MLSSHQINSLTPVIDTPSAMTTMVRYAGTTEKRWTWGRTSCSRTCSTYTVRPPTSTPLIGKTLLQTRSTSRQISHPQEAIIIQACGAESAFQLSLPGAAPATGGLRFTCRMGSSRAVLDLLGSKETVLIMLWQVRSRRALPTSSGLLSMQGTVRPGLSLTTGILGTSSTMLCTGKYLVTQGYATCVGKFDVRLVDTISADYPESAKWVFQLA